MEEIKIIVSEEEGATRLDALCAAHGGDHSREYIKKRIAAGDVTVNGQIKKASHRVTAGEEVVLTIPEPETYTVEAENIPLDIIYEDSDLLVVNKPKGMVVHPAPGNYTGTLVNALMYHTVDLSGINGVNRPGIIHRIDKDTTGLLMVAKNDLAHQGLSVQLKDHSITRQYRALAKGIVKADSGTMDMPLGRHPKDRIRMAVMKERGQGREAITHFKVVSRYTRGYTLLTFRLETGRTQKPGAPTKYGYTWPPSVTPLPGMSCTGGIRAMPLKPTANASTQKSWALSTPAPGSTWSLTPPCPRTLQPF